MSEESKKTVGEEFLARVTSTRVQGKFSFGDQMDLLQALRELDPELASRAAARHWLLPAIEVYTNLTAHVRLTKILKTFQKLIAQEKLEEEYRSLVNAYAFGNGEEGYVERLSNAYCAVYRAMFNMPMRRKLVGLWPIIFVDCCVDIRTEFTFSEFAFSVASRHPDVLFTSGLNAADVARYGDGIGPVISFINAKIADLKKTEGEVLAGPLRSGSNVQVGNQVMSKVRLLLEIFHNMLQLLQISQSIYEKWKEDAARESAQREKDEQTQRETAEFLRGFKEVPDASNYIDRFDKNRGHFGSIA